MKAIELIYNIQNLRSKGVQSQSNDLSDRQVMFMIDYYRSMLVKQYLDKQTYIGNILEQDLGTLQLETVSETESYSICGGIDLDIGCIKRSVLQIPTLIESKKEVSIAFAGSTDLRELYQATTYNKIIWDKYAKYTGRNKKVFILNNYLYLYAPDNPIQKYMRFRGIFNSPVEVQLFLNTSTGNTFSDPMDIYNFEYPIISSMVDTIYKLIIDAEFRVLNTGPKDTLNNSRDDLQA